MIEQVNPSVLEVSDDQTDDDDQHHASEKLQYFFKRILICHRSGQVRLRHWFYRLVFLYRHRVSVLSVFCTVAEYAFMSCTSLETVTIPENVVSFGDRVFAKCTSLKTVTMQSDIVSMPTNIFSGCSSLENLTLNENIAEFSYGCFNGCSSLTDLDFVSNGVLLQSYAFNGTGAESVVLSDSLLAIPKYAFTNCPNLRYVTIPESVTLIQPKACDWENVTIRCYENSAAHSFAEENNLSYVLLRKVMLGNVNNDGEVNITDVTTIQQYLAEMAEFDELQQAAADANRDNTLDISDATALQMYLAGYEQVYPIGQFLTL